MIAAFIAGLVVGMVLAGALLILAGYALMRWMVG